MKKIITVAFVGRSGSGKSLAVKYFQSKGVSSIDCDILARRVVDTGSSCLIELTMEFGDDILNPDGTLNRTALAAKAFNNMDSKTKLDSITHPYILLELQNELDILTEKGEKLCVIEAPALFESGLNENVDKIVLISSEYENLVNRITSRDEIDIKQAKTRIDIQLDDETLVNKVDFVIYNNGSDQDFFSSLDILYENIQEYICITDKE